MPFIPKERREALLNHISRPNKPGEYCYLEYQNMMDKWMANPRWKTVDRIADRFWPQHVERATILAFLVFFILHVMPYEKRKRKENGDIR